MKITIKNYRGFGNQPQEFEIREGFTALIGLNNVGKSSLLKLFYELRPLWQNFSYAGNLCNFLNGSANNFQVQGVNDVDELFNHFTNNPIEITFSTFNEEANSNFTFTVRLTKVSSSQLNFTKLNFNIDNPDLSFITFTTSNQDLNVLCRSTTTNSNTNYSLLNFLNFFKKLHQTIYIPAFRNLINAGEKSGYYDISTGTAFISQWDQWKNGSEKSARDKITKITDDIKNLFGYKNLEINPSSDKTTLRINIDNKSYSLADVGSGLSQFILVFASAAIKKPTFILIDEPEISLHPSLQLKFLSSLASYASEGVIFATHSIGLARSAAEYIYSVTNNGQETKINTFSNTPNYIALLGELSFSTYQEIGANCILFVEGPTEVKTIQEFLRKFNKDSKVLMFPLGGSSMINGSRKMELAEIVTRLNVKKTYAWIDSEKSNPNVDVAHDRKQFLEACKEIGIIAKASDRRALENYFTERSVRTVLNDQGKNALAEFEKLDPSTHWVKNDNWKLAREMTIDELKVNDLGKFIADIDCD